MSAKSVSYAVKAAMQHTAQQRMLAAMLAARKRAQLGQDKQPGMLTNEAGPRVMTNPAPNAHPEDGDG